MPRSIVIRTLFENGEGQAVDGRGMFGLSYDVERSSFAGYTRILDFIVTYIRVTVIVFTKEAVEGTWKWGEHDLPTVAKYTFLGIDFASNGAWDGHIKKVLDCGRKKVNQLQSVISNRYINLSARRLLLLSVVRPSLEYGSEVWEGNKSQAAALESALLGCPIAPYP